MKHAQNVTPCRHVRKYVENQASGHPQKWWNFIGWLHVRSCPQCQEAMNRLRDYFQTLTKDSEPSLEDESKKIMNTLRQKMCDDNE